MLVQERGIRRERDSIPGEGPVVVGINRIVYGRAGNPGSFSRLRSRRRQCDGAAAVDIRRAAQIGTAAVSPRPFIDDTDVPRIADLPVRAAFPPVWRAAV